MTKKEKAYIQEQANQFFKRYEEENRKSREANDPDEKAKHCMQATLNWSIYDICEQLMDGMKELKLGYERERP